MVVRCAADRAGRQLARGHDRGLAWPRRPRRRRSTRPPDGPRLGQRGQAPDRTRRAGSAARPWSTGRPSGPTEAHLLEEQLRRVPLGQVGVLLDLDAVDPPLHRQQRQRKRIGDEAGAAARRVDRRAARFARVEDPVAGFVAERSTTREELTAGGDDVRAGLQQGDDLLEFEPLAACRARSPRRPRGPRRDRWSRRRPPGSRRTARRRRPRPWPGRRRRRPTSSRSG